MTLRARKKNCRLKILQNGGYTIVELLTAALIMAVATVAIVSVIRMTLDARITDGQRRTARAIIMDTFEDSFAYNMFAETYTVRGQTSSGFPWTSEPIPVTLEVREEGEDVVGVMTVNISEEDDIAGLIDSPIPAHLIEISIDWTDANRANNITLVKRLTEINW